MRGMFRDCTNLLDASGLNSWDISNVKIFSYMFRNCPSHPTFVDSDVNPISGSWDSNGTFNKTT